MNWSIQWAAGITLLACISVSAPRVEARQEFDGPEAPEAPQVPGPPQREEPKAVDPGDPLLRDLSPEIREKMPDQNLIVVVNLKRGIPQKVLVSLDNAAAQALRATGDEVAIADSVTRLAAEIFPGGRLGRAELLQTFGALPTALVDVPDYPALVELARHPKVLNISEIPVVKPQAGSHLSFSGVPQAQLSGWFGYGYSVAVLDGGLYDPGVFGCKASWEKNQKSDWGTGNCRIKEALNFVARVPRSSEIQVFPSFDNFHGQSVTKIVIEVAPGAILRLYQVFDGKGDIQDGIAILNALAEVLRKRTDDPPIVAVNLSFAVGVNANHTGYCDTANPVLASAIREVRDRDIAVVAAAGNFGQLNAMSMPACFRGVVSVTAITSEPTKAASYTGWSLCSDPMLDAGKFPCFSNVTGNTTFAAPGVNINDGISIQSGTSQAAPHVAAGYAVLRGKYGSWKNIQELTAQMQRCGTVRDQRNLVRREVPLFHLDCALANAGERENAPDVPGHRNGTPEPTPGQPQP